jgi:NADH-quinone oxidoreductase subunit L
MGGLRRYMPYTAITFLIATLAIAGLPPLAGFFSKDEILFSAFRYGLNDHGWAYFVWIIGLVTAVLTAVYMGRCYLLTFEGSPRWPGQFDVKPHESPWTMTLPLVVLAVLSVVGGFLGLPHVLGQSWIHHWLGAPYGGPVVEPELELEVAAATEWSLLLLGAGIAVAGLGLAWVWWGRRGLEFDTRLRQRTGALYRWASRKWYWDEVYDRAVVGPLVRGAREGLAPFDQNVVDGAVNGTAAVVQRAAGGLRLIQTGVVQAYALAVVLGVVAVVALMLFI